MSFWVEQSNKLRDGVILTILLLCGIFLRLFQLGFHCMWTEELYTLKLTGLSYYEIVSQVMSTDYNPPLFYITASVFKTIFHTDLAIRYPSILCGIILIPVMYLVGKEYKNSFTGLCAAGFVAFLYPLIYYSQFGRAYEMCILFFAITILIYLKLYTYGTDFYCILFGISAGITVYIHLFAAIPISLLIGEFIFSTRRRTGLLSGTIFLLTCLPLVGMFISILYNRLPNMGFNYGMSLVTLLYMTPLEFFNLAVPFFLVFCSIAWIRGLRLDRLFLTVTVVTILFGLASSLVTPFFPRYYLETIVLLLPVTAATLSDLIFDSYSGERDVIILIIILSGLVFTQAPDLISYYFTQQYTC